MSPRDGRTCDRVAVLGGGNMGSALVKGLLDSGARRPADVVVTDVDAGRRTALTRSLRVRTSDDNRTTAGESDIILLCVKPSQAGDVLKQISGAVTANQLVLSVVAGLRTERIESILGPVPVVRVMPNTPALVRAGALVFCLGQHAEARHERSARNILSPLGPVWKTAEKQMDAVTALSGSGPAYVFFLSEILAQAGSTLGLDPAMAEALARQTIFGAGRMLAETPVPAGELRRRVTSPGGTTEAALAVLNQAGVPAIFQRALSAACARSIELSAAPKEERSALSAKPGKKRRVHP